MSQFFLTLGNFGTNVGSYFRLVRWLCMLNLALSLLSFVLLIIPQVGQLKKKNGNSQAEVIFSLQLVAGHGLAIPNYVRGNLTPYSYLIDGEVSLKNTTMAKFLPQ